MAYLQKNPPKKSIYVQSGSVYTTLLMAASTPKDIPIIISHDSPSKFLIRTTFILNNIRDRAFFEEESEKAKHLQETDIIVTDQAAYLKNAGQKPTLLLV